MSGHTLPYDLNSAPYEMADPGGNVKFSPDRWNASIALEIASSDGQGAIASGLYGDNDSAMNLLPPTADGQRLRIYCASRAGSGVRNVYTTNSDATNVAPSKHFNDAFEAAYISQYTFNAVGKMVVLESFPNADGTYLWKLVSSDGLQFA